VAVLTFRWQTLAVTKLGNHMAEARSGVRAVPPL